MNLTEKFAKWSTKVEKGSEKYEAYAYAFQSDALFHVLKKERKNLHQMYVGVFDKGRLVNSFYYCGAGMGADTHRPPKMAVIIKDGKEIICNIGEEYYSNQNKDEAMEIIMLYSTEAHVELVFAAPNSIPYVAAEYATLNVRPEFRYRYAKLLIEGVRLYLGQNGTVRLPEVSIDAGTQLCEEADEDGLGQ